MEGVMQGIEVALEGLWNEGRDRKGSEGEKKRDGTREREKWECSSLRVE